MTTCDDFRRALSRLRDGEAPPQEAEEARAHAAACDACRADLALWEAVGNRLRGGPGAAEAPAAPPGLREAVVARLRRGEAAVLELHPFLRRAAAAAAAVLVASTAAAFWQAALRPSAPAAKEAGITRDEVVAQMVRTRLGIGR